MPESILAESHIAILGLGLMGGSLAYALAGKCDRLSGVDPDLQILELARSSGLFEHVCRVPEEITSPVDVWILAAPVGAILAILEDMPGWQHQAGIVIDIGSTKARITAAMQLLPERFDPLGGHPMCGKETGGFASAEAGLFSGTAFSWCRLERSSERAIQLACELTALLDAQPLWLDPETHDRWVAATSHLPYLLANALAAATPLEAAPLVGPGFRSTTRLAGSPPEMMLDVLLTNREHILAVARRFQGHFSDLIALLESTAEPDTTGLCERLESGCQKRNKLLDPENLP